MAAGAGVTSHELTIEELIADRLMLLYPEDVRAIPTSETAVHLTVVRRSCASAELINLGMSYALQKPRHALHIVAEYSPESYEIDPFEAVLSKFIIRCEPYMDHILRKAQKYYRPDMSSAEKQALILDFSTALCEETTHELQAYLHSYKMQLSWLHEKTPSDKKGEISDIKQFLKIRIISLLGSCLSETEGSLFALFREELKAALISYRIALYQCEYIALLLKNVNPLIIESVIHNLLLGLKEGIQHVSPGQSIVIPLQWEHHALYLEIKKDTTWFKMYVHNYGAGVAIMHEPVGDTHFFPYWVRCPRDTAYSGLERGDFEYEYLRNIFLHTFPIKTKEKAMPIFYPGDPRSYDPDSPIFREQAHGDCVSYAYGRARGLSAELVNHEIALLDRVWEPIPVIGRGRTTPFADAKTSDCTLQNDAASK